MTTYTINRAEQPEAKLAKLVGRIMALDRRLLARAMELHRAAIAAGDEQSPEGQIVEDCWGSVHSLLEA